MADGCVLEFKNKKTGKLKAMALQISLKSTEIEHLKKFKKDIGTEAPISINNIKLNKNDYYSCKIVVCCTKMCRDLIELNCTPRKSLTLEYPFGKIPKEFEHDFIRGYFDGDGSISFRFEERLVDGKSINTIKNAYSNILGTYNFISAISDILLENGITNRIKHYENSVPEIRLSGINNLYNLYNYLYKNSTVCLERKYEKFQELFYLK